MTQTVLTEEELSSLARDFGLGDFEEARRLDVGTINSNYCVESGGARYFLRVNEGKRDEDVAYEAALIEALAAAGVSTPAPIAATSGEAFARVGRKQISLFPWVEGDHREGEALSALDLEALGRSLARLHAASAPLAGLLGRPSIYATARIAERAAAIDAGADAELTGALGLAKEELSELATLGPPGQPIIIHGDLFSDNVLFRGCDVAALLDFEQASSGHALYDVAVCLTAWCSPRGVFEVGLGRALIAGYRRERRLEGLTAQALWIECRRAAVRFTVTRITDVYLAGVVRAGKDYREFLTKLEALRTAGAPAIEALL